MFTPIASIDAIGIKYTYRTNCINQKFDVTLMQLVQFDAIG